MVLCNQIISFHDYCIVGYMLEDIVSLLVIPSFADAGMAGEREAQFCLLCKVSKTGGSQNMYLAFKQYKNLFKKLERSTIYIFVITYPKTCLRNGEKRHSLLCNIVSHNLHFLSLGLPA